MRVLSRNEIIVRNRKLMVAALVVCTFIMAFIFFSNRAAAENSKEVNTFYTSYEIQPGDTLWSIADKYMTPESSDREAFINRIKKLNHISSDNITAGNYLVIEYIACKEL